MAWLNHAGTSWPKPEPVQRAVIAATTSDPSAWAEAFEVQQRAIASHLGVPDVSRLLLSPGCTSALNAAISDHPWEPGDRILIGHLEHHALHRPALKLAETGVEVVVCRPADWERELAKGARLVAVAAAANTTGELAPIEQIVELAHGNGALVLIDAAQLAGWTDDIASLGDLVCFAGHKGPQAPWGIGGLIVAPHVIMKSPAATCDPGEDALEACALMPGYCDVGSVDRIAMAGLAAGLDYVSGLEGRLERARAQVERLVVGALELGATLHGPRAPSLRMPTAALTFDGWRPARIGRELADRGVHVSAGLQCAPMAHRELGTDPWGIVRLSAGPTTADSDIEDALGALEELLR